MPPLKVLVVDDDVHLTAALAELLGAAGFETTTAASVEDALDRCREDTFHLVLCDLQLPGRNGLALVRTLHEACPSTATVLVTGHGSIRSAVTALKRGAVEYVTKPIKPKRLLALCRTLTADPPAFLPNALRAGDRAPAVTFDGMHARSRAMLAVFERIQLAAAGDTPVLVAGESGTGKEVVARSIHARSRRASGPFVAVHTGAIPPGLLASELFGHERNAFAGAGERHPGKLERAEGGTLFLDEISATDERTQLHLLRVLETSRYTRVGGRKERVADVRIVAASNRDLEALARAGGLRQELYYRLRVFVVPLPPLRERSDDIPLLATETMRELAAKYGKPVAVIPPDALRLMSAYPWPGNERELRNVVEQAVLLARGEVLDPALLPQLLHRAPPREELIKIPVGTPMEDIEKEVILRTLAAHQGNKTATAGALGISRRSIYNKLAGYGL